MKDPDEEYRQAIALFRYGLITPICCRCRPAVPVASLICFAKIQRAERRYNMEQRAQLVQRLLRSGT